MKDEFKKILTTTRRGDLLHSSVVEKDVPGKGRLYFAEVHVKGALTGEDGPFYDQDEAEQRADVMREDEFKKLCNR